MAQYVVLVQWSPADGQLVFLGRVVPAIWREVAPAEFSRFPSWSCEVMAALFAVSCSHWVDDVIAIDPEEVVMAGWYAWKGLQSCLGWELSARKSPQPSACFDVIGVHLDLTEAPSSSP